LPGVGAILISIVLVIPGYMMTLGLALAMHLCKIEIKRRFAPLNALLLYVFLSFTLNIIAMIALGQWSTLSWANVSSAAATVLTVPHRNTALVAAAIRTLVKGALLYIFWRDFPFHAANRSRRDYGRVGAVERRALPSSTTTPLWSVLPAPLPFGGHTVRAKPNARPRPRSPLTPPPRAILETSLPQ